MNSELYQLNCNVASTLTALKTNTSFINPYIQKQITVVNGFHTIYEEMKQEIKIVTLNRTTTDHRFSQQEITQLYNHWKYEYKRLKLMMKTILLGREELTEQIFVDGVDQNSLNKDTQ